MSSKALKRASYPEDHPFRVIKHLFDHVKARYHGIAENTARLPALFALSILWMLRRQLDGTSGLLQISKSSEKSANASRNAEEPGANSTTDFNIRLQTRGRTYGGALCRPSKN